VNRSYQHTCNILLSFILLPPFSGGEAEGSRLSETSATLYQTTRRHVQSKRNFCTSDLIKRTFSQTDVRHVTCDHAVVTNLS